MTILAYLYVSSGMIELETIPLIINLHPQYVGWRTIVLSYLKRIALPYNTPNQGKNDFIYIICMMVCAIHHPIEIGFQFLNLINFYAHIYLYLGIKVYFYKCLLQIYRVYGKYSKIHR